MTESIPPEIILPEEISCLTELSLDELRARFPEDIVKALLDGLPYHITLEILYDKSGNKARDSYEIRNRYDGNLMGKLSTTWTYWDEKQRIVRDMTIDDGIGIKRRTIVHHRSNSEPELVETLVVEPEPSQVEVIIDKVLGALGF